MQSINEPIEKPEREQLAELRALADQRGESFTWPETKEQAAAEIERLGGRPSSSWSVRAVERRAVSRAMARRGGATSVREDEVIGYGSSAHWAIGQ